jgi:serine/threonine protein kinase
MTLFAGIELGPYEIVSPLGAGGMAEMYRATDKKLNREVAIKVIPAEFVRDEQRLARFEREAQLLAALNHTSRRHAGVVENVGETDLRAISVELENLR